MARKGNSENNSAHPEVGQVTHSKKLPIPLCQQQRESRQTAFMETCHWHVPRARQHESPLPVLDGTLFTHLGLPSVKLVAQGALGPHTQLTATHGARWHPGPWHVEPTSPGGPPCQAPFTLATQQGPRSLPRLLLVLITRHARLLPCIHRCQEHYPLNKAHPPYYCNVNSEPLR